MNMPEKAFGKSLNIFFLNIAIAYGFLNLLFIFTPLPYMFFFENRSFRWQFPSVAFGRVVS